MRTIYLVTALLVSTLLTTILWALNPITADNSASDLHRQIINNIALGNNLHSNLQVENTRITLEEIKHLEDVHTIFKLIYIVLPILLATIIKSTKQVSYNYPKEIIVFLIGSIIILSTFSSAFTLFHQIFFPQGNWSFPADSLLIQLYPLNIWRNIALIWLLFGGFVYLSLLRYTNIRNK